VRTKKNAARVVNEQHKQSVPEGVEAKDSGRLLTFINVLVAFAAFFKAAFTDTR
jgi:hypothetical protein